jgi:flagellar basal body-associated protein FliL
MLPATKKKKMNPLLMKVIIISVLAHLMAGFILGSYIVVKAVLPSEAQFEEPPAVVEEEPPPPVKVQIKPQQPKQ